MRNTFSHAVAQSHPYIPSHSLPYIFPLHNPASVDFAIFWDIPSQNRTGHIFVPGPTLGAAHAALEGIMEEVDNLKVKRSIYAETQREKAGILEGIRSSEWNAETNPLILVLQEPETVTHDFNQGSVCSLFTMEINGCSCFLGRPCRIAVDLVIRNYSSTHRSRFTLGVDASSIPSSTS